MHAKCPPIEMRIILLPKNKDSCDEVARRKYCTSDEVKNERVRI